MLKRRRGRRSTQESEGKRKEIYCSYCRPAQAVQSAFRDITPVGIEYLRAKAQIARTTRGNMFNDEQCNLQGEYLVIGREFVLQSRQE